MESAGAFSSSLAALFRIGAAAAGRGIDCAIIGAGGGMPSAPPLNPGPPIPYRSKNLRRSGWNEGTSPRLRLVPWTQKALAWDSVVWTQPTDVRTG